MRLVDLLKRRIVRLLTTPGEELGRWTRILQFQIGLWRFCIRRLRENNVLAMSAALSFRTILAMVPILILAFLMLKPLGVVEDSKKVLRDLMQDSGLAQIVYVESSQSQPTSAPASNDGNDRITLVEKIESAIDHAEGKLTVGRLGPIGVVLLIWTTLTLLTTMERCLNRIFEAPRTRALSRRILLYWSAMTLGPLVLITVRYAGDKATDAAQNMPVLSWVIWWIGWAGPIVVGVVLLAVLYKLMPNTRVRFRSAVTGAIVAVLLWMIARWGFALYVENVGKQNIYGAMGLVPLFLMWLNLSWWIFLFGAELAHTAANLSRMQSAEKRKTHLLGPWDLLAAMVAVARGNVVGEGPVPIEQVSAALNLSDESAEDLLSRLCSNGFVCRVADEESGIYLPARSADGIRVSDILRIGFAYGPGGSDRKDASEIDEAIRLVRRRTDAGIEKLTIAEIIS
ncbi:MAG: YihY family inner membrane protein [Phycisphaerae bacterium]|nr:YihY family inner membrane protein [Phycisphaerae bacterium]